MEPGSLLPQLTERQLVRALRSLPAAATQPMTHCWHSRDGIMLVKEEMFGVLLTQLQLKMRVF